MDNNFQAKISELTAQAAKAQERFWTLEAQRQGLELERMNAQTALNGATTVKAMDKATATVASARARLSVVSEALAEARATLASIEAQKKALEATRVREENLARTAEWVLHGAQLRTEFDEILAEMEAVLLDGFQRLSDKRDQQKATREGMERAILACDPALAQNFPTTTAEQDADKQHAFAFRQAMARFGVDERTLSLAVRAECEGHPAVLSQSVSPNDLAPEPKDGLKADFLRELKQAREAVKYGRPTPLLKSTGAVFVGVADGAPLPIFLPDAQLAPFPCEPPTPFNPAAISDAPTPPEPREEVSWVAEG